MTPVENYLSGRRITLAPPRSLRWHPGLRHPSGLVLPAMVAAVQGPDGRITAIHRTFLTPDGRAKADVETAKMALGPLGNGAVRLAEAAGTFLGIAEGVETALSAMQLFQNFPVWASLGAERMGRLWIPPEVQLVVIFGDADDAGVRAAETAARAFAETGRLVDIRFPAVGCDFNDELRAAAAAA